MHTNLKKRKLEKIAPGSRLIRLINKLYNLSDIREAERYQEKIDKLNLSFSVFSQEGRLELIDELIMGRRDDLDDSEKKALYFFLEVLNNRIDAKETLSGFYIDYLTYTIRKYAKSPDNEYPQNLSLLNNKQQNKLPAKNVFIALSLSGLVVAGCSPPKDIFQSFYSGKNDDTVSAPYRRIVHQKINQNDPAIINTAPKIIEKIDSEKLNQTAENLGKKIKKEIEAWEDTYTVKKGDSIRKIAARRGCDYRKIVTQNKIRYDKKRDWFVLFPGQTLKLPPGVQPDNTAEGVAQRLHDYKKSADLLSLRKNNVEDGFKYHLITKGDSLGEISKRYNVPIKKIAAVNNIKNLDKVKFGDMLKIPVAIEIGPQRRKPFNLMSRTNKVRFLKERTIKAGHPYIATIVEVSEEYKIDPRLYASLIWEESWFDKNAQSKDDCRKLAQLDPRFHVISEDIKKNLEKSLGYFRYEFVYYRKQGFDMKSAAICALAAYNGGNTRIRNYIKDGKWDGKNIETIPLKETREHIKKVLHRCATNYQASL